MEAFRSGDAERARGLSETALTAARTKGDVRAEVDAMCMLARVALRAGQLERVRALARKARTIARSSDDPRLERMPLHMEAVVARMLGEPSLARRPYRESIELNRSLGEERIVAAELRNLAYVELRDGRLDDARELFMAARREALASDAGSHLSREDALHEAFGTDG